ncbi:fumarate reductase flavoprotein subunit [hydrocarbon metagenome]|uniref:Fumarate reductase flavoprotein subunit n=1 Tax=hydrocarbon metagenome TaxID=938273 RepID=A0A0W8E439_9ZZZZ
MSEENKINQEVSEQGISRRQFIKGAAIGTVGVASVAMLPGCAPKTETGHEAETAENVSFETPPEPIPDSEIKSTVAADIIVVGGGLSGFCAAISAAEEGAKVVLLEKGTVPALRGIDYGAIGSKLQKSIGNEIDREAAVREIMRFGGYKADQKVVSLWADHSGAAVDWLVEKAESVGITADPVPLVEQTITGATWNDFATMAFSFNPTDEAMASAPQGTSPKQAAMKWVLENNAQKYGVDIQWKTPAEQLVRDDQGKVISVIAKSEDGSYIKFNAATGVILATGDYGNNPEMLKKFIPSSEDIYDIAYPGTVNTGDGHKMGLWIGAAMDELPHAPMYFDQGVIGRPGGKPVPLTRQPWLYVNLNGERFSNEDLPYAYNCNAVRQQPEHVKWVVFDAKWPEKAPIFEQIACKRMIPPAPLHNEDEVKALIENETIKSAATIDELAGKMGVPIETFKANVARYNELATQGKDVDFGKRLECLTTIEQAPFYAVQTGATLLVTLGGLKVNDKLHVLDTELKAIPGLYAVGNVSGCFYANDYPNILPGNSHGRAITFGWLAGKNATKA